MHASQWTKRRGYRMRLELPSLVAYRDEPLNGQARVESVSNSEVAVNNLRVWAWVVTGDGSSQASAKAMVVRSDRLPPLEQRGYPVELSFAPNSAIGNGTVMLTSGLAIFAARRRCAS